jgi:hypothetical protein
VELRLLFLSLNNKIRYTQDRGVSELQGDLSLVYNPSSMVWTSVLQRLGTPKKGDGGKVKREKER